MVIVNLKGGLGNQMFQYALGYILARKNKLPLSLDLRFLKENLKNPPKGYVVREFDLDLFGLEPHTPSRLELLKVGMLFGRYSIRRKILLLLYQLKILVIVERSRKFDESVLNVKKKNIYLDGYWQSEKYFKEFRSEILEIFSFEKTKNFSGNKEFIDALDLANSICINVRRGDFVGSKEHDTVGMDFYHDSIERFRQWMGVDPHLYVFSDDINWCSENFRMYDRVTYMGDDRRGDRHFNYLYLMSIFNNFIIPNSTFAWWGAWLARSRDKVVIAPKKWSGTIEGNEVDIVPAEWLRA